MVRGFTIHELAELVGMSARNIRAYQSRGLLPPPSVRGRVAHYDAQHVARLALIRALQLQGFSLDGIRRVVETPTAYAALAQDGRPETTTWELPPSVPIGPGVDRLRAIRPSLPDELAAVGILVRDDDGDYATAPAIAGLGSRLVRAGVPADVVVLTQLAVAEAAARLAAEFAARIRSCPPSGDETPTENRLEPDEALRVALQLFASGFERGFAHGAGIGDPRG